MPIDPDALVRRWTELKSIRAPFEPEWRKAALTCLPRQYGGWQTQGSGAGTVTGGALSDSSAAAQGAQEARLFVPDTTAQRALPKYVALLSSLLTPQQQTWHTLAPDDDALARIKAVRDYFDTVNRVLFRARYEPAAGFEVAQFQTYAALGVYGTGPKFIAKRRQRLGSNHAPGIIYRAQALRNTWLATNDEGAVDTAFRLVPNMTARNVQKAFPTDTLPPSVQVELQKANISQQTEFEILHIVMPNEDFDAQALSVNRFPFLGVYLATKDRFLIGEPEGYRTFPFPVARDYSEPGVVYGYSPASMALGSIGTANAIKKTLIKQGQKTVDPVYLAYDDSVINGRIGAAPGSVVWGGIDNQGRRLVQPLEVGNVQAAEPMLQDERDSINDSFLVSLYQILNENPEMTATEVMQRAAEKAALLAPTMGRLQSTDLGPTIEREIDLLQQLGKLPPMPPELQEAAGQYRVVYVSPLAKQQMSEPVAAFMRSVQWAAQAAQQTGDASILARFNFQAAMPDILEAQGVPSTWVNSDDQVQAIMQARQQQQQVDMAAKAAPAVAGMAKAAAVAQQAGGGATGAAAAPAVQPISLPE